MWIDTDDIRGSERWRTSVATAIRGSDVVLLVVSPPSMASSSVEREISVAAEDSLRILPVVIEAAPISVGPEVRPRRRATRLVRRSAVRGGHGRSHGGPDRPGDRDTGRDRSRAAAGHGSSDADRIGVPPRRRPSRSGAVRVGAVVVLIAAILVARQFGSDSDDAGTDVSAESPDVPATAVADGAVDAADAGAIATEATFDTTVWFAGYSIQVTEAEYDEATSELTIDVAFTNDQRTAADPLNLLIESTPLVVDGTRYRLDCTNCTRLPPSSSTRATCSTRRSPVVSIWPRRRLEFGTPDQHQAIVPLDGSPGTTESPTSAPIEGTLVDGVTTFTAETVEIHPGGLLRPGLRHVLHAARSRRDEHRRHRVGSDDRTVRHRDGTSAAHSARRWATRLEFVERLHVRAHSRRAAARHPRLLQRCRRR